LIADEFAGSQGDGRFSVGHIGWGGGGDAVDELWSLSTDRDGGLTEMGDSAAQIIQYRDDFDVC